ncbi:MAG: FliM/FliN family flagellar motor switch protein [Deltaproteobacteria bacterium]|nr:FliM/FliN family flagellar motor switch protein [Deltaproteobacteria bacterium]
MQKRETSNVHVSGLGPLELQQFHLLGARFFDQLCINLSRYLMLPLKMAEVKQGLETFGQFCKDTQAQLVFAAVLESAATLVFRARVQMLRLIVDALFSASDEKLPGGEDSANLGLSATESRILIQILGGAFTTAVEQIFGSLFGGRRVVDMMQNVDHVSLLNNALAAGELILTAEMSGTLKGQSGDFVLGFPLSLTSLLLPKEPPSSLNSSDASGGLQGLSRVAAIPVELSAILAERELSLAEVRHLKPGSVIILQRLRRLPKAQLRAAGQALFRGTIVENRGWRNFLIQELETADAERAAE